MNLLHSPRFSNIAINISFFELSRIERSYFANDVKKSSDLVQRKGFFSLNPGDKVEIDGESSYQEQSTLYHQKYRRKTLDLDLTVDLQFMEVLVLHDIMIELLVKVYVEAEIENGSVTKLIWNERQEERMFKTFHLTITNATYDPVTGVFVGTIPNHGFSARQFVRFKNNSVVFTCALDNNATEHSYPRAGVDPFGRSMDSY